MKGKTLLGFKKPLCLKCSVGIEDHEYTMQNGEKTFTL